MIFGSADVKERSLCSSPESEHQEHHDDESYPGEGKIGRYVMDGQGHYRRWKEEQKAFDDEHQDADPYNQQQKENEPR
jgi:hypothetical protein